MNVLEKILEEIKKLKCNQDSENQDYKVGYLSALSTVEGVIAGLNDGWIPVEERLPEEDDGKRYIVTDVHGLVCSEMEYGHLVDGNGEVCFHKWDDEYWSCYKPKVIAWQPLPEAYHPKEAPAAEHIMSRFTRVE